MRFNPIMIGVDGGANALLDFGYRPDIIIGDMDSVSDISLMNCKEIIVSCLSQWKLPGDEEDRISRAESS